METAFIKFVQVESTQNHMATTFSFRISCEKRDQFRATSILEEAHRLVHGLEKEITEFWETSPVYKLNHSVPGEKILFSEEGKSLFFSAMNFRADTKGAFDPLAKSCSSSPSVEVDGSFLTRNNRGTHLGFGAIGKGYALDIVRTWLEQNGFRNYLLNAGGSSLIFSGFAFPEQAWKWAWAWEKMEEDLYGAELSHTSGKTVALGVSGVMEQGEHILSKRQGASGTKSALVVADSAHRADALSTALFVLGWQQKDKIKSEGCALVNLQSDLYWDEGFYERWGNLC